MSSQKETISSLTREIRNLAHHGWEDRPNAEFLFREIGKRAQKIAELAEAGRGSSQESAPEEWMRQAARELRIKIHGLEKGTGCQGADAPANKKWLDSATAGDAEIIRKWHAQKEK